MCHTAGGEEGRTALLSMPFVLVIPESEVDVSHTVTLQETTTVSHTVTLQDTTAVLTRLADRVDSWIRLGIRPPLPEDLVLAAERITAAMTIPQPTALTQMPISQLVLVLVTPGEDVTAKDIGNRLAGFGRDTTNQAVSVALHRAAKRGLFKRRKRGVYRRLVTPENHAIPS